MKRKKTMEEWEKEMNPHPRPDDFTSTRPESTHGTIGNMHGTRRGILVSVKKLKKRGVPLTKRERAVEPPVVGELLIERLHDRDLDHQSVAKIVRFGAYHFPSSEAILCNPEVFAADERGMVIQGIEKAEVEGGAWASFQQVWLVLFGLPPPEPPP